ncbi:NOG1 [Hirschfeldia incana]|nr:NOG1 [Hirschfeldia incana]
MKLASSLLFPNQWRLLTSPHLYLQAFLYSTDSCFSTSRRHFKPTSYITQKQIETPPSPALLSEKGIEVLNSLFDALMKDTWKVFQGGDSCIHMSPSIIQLTLGDGNYDQVLGKVDALRKKVQSVGKEHASLCAKALSKREAEDRLSEGRSSSKKRDLEEWIYLSRFALCTPRFSLSLVTSKIKIKKKMDDVHELQRKINDYERQRMRYQRNISRLEDDLFQRDQEIIRAKFTILQALPELNTPENGPLVDIVRVPGYLDPKMFEAACLNNPSDDGREGETMRKDRAILEAETLCNEWRSKTSNGLWELYIEGPEQGEEDDWVQVEAQDLLDLKEKYGEELYNVIKIAWAESKERTRTGVQLKPWDYEAGREKTLTELLVPLREKIQFLVMKTSEEGK